MAVSNAPAATCSAGRWQLVDHWFAMDGPGFGDTNSSPVPSRATSSAAARASGGRSRSSISHPSDPSSSKPMSPSPSSSTPSPMASTSSSSPHASATAERSTSSATAAAACATPLAFSASFVARLSKNPFDTVRRGQFASFVIGTGILSCFTFAGFGRDGKFSSPISASNSATSSARPLVQAVKYANDGWPPSLKMRTRSFASPI
mmetsp:Transcript_9822/g.19427  ORF Transcript_9822/g.19427 Transcript_9822/m.19427 type:complete len:205 (-) Transcript_9822:1264-1878(-)